MPSTGKRDLGALFDGGVEWSPIAPQARVVWTLASVAVAAPVLVLLAAVLTVAGGLPGLVAALALSALVLGLVRWLVGRRYRSWGYSVRDDELVLRRGVLVRRLTIVPIGRMQFIDITQGPLDRWLHVTNVQLHTAAAASDAKVPLLAVDDAERLRAELTARGAGRSGGT